MSNTKIKFEEVPHYIQIETSYSCNALCVFCYNPKRNQPIDLNKVREIVGRVAESNIPHVQLTGGEISILPIAFINEIVDRLSKHSSVTIQTNGILYMKDLTKNLAALYVSLHGTEKYHDDLQAVGEWKKIVENIKHYINDGFEVNLDFTLTAQNYSNFEEIAMMADSWGVTQYSLNKFQPAGYGAKNFNDMVPSVAQFKDVISQIIRLQDKTNLKIGFCTAVPFCLDDRLSRYGLLASCGAGTYLAAISPDGEMRICNQSFTSYGNVLKKDLLEIWNSRKIDEFRDKSWVTKPCTTCELFDQCLGGCKVDNTSKSRYCVDYAIRDLEKCPIKISEFKKQVQEFSSSQIKALQDIGLPTEGVITANPFTKLITSHKTNLLITKHQTIKLDQKASILIEKILVNKMINDHKK